MLKNTVYYLSNIQTFSPCFFSGSDALKISIVRHGGERVKSWFSVSSGYKKSINIAFTQVSSLNSEVLGTTCST